MLHMELIAEGPRAITYTGPDVYGPLRQRTAYPTANMCTRPQEQHILTGKKAHLVKKNKPLECS